MSQLSKERILDFSRVSLLVFGENFDAENKNLFDILVIHTYVSGHKTRIFNAIVVALSNNVMLYAGFKEIEKFVTILEKGIVEHGKKLHRKEHNSKK